MGWTMRSSENRSPAEFLLGGKLAGALCLHSDVMALVLLGMISNDQ